MTMILKKYLIFSLIGLMSTNAVFAIQAKPEAEKSIIVEDEEELKEIRITGNSLISDEDLKYELMQFYGLPINEENVEQIISEIRSIYEDLDYPLVNVRKTKESAKKGVLNIAILEFTFAGFRINGKGLPKNGVKFLEKISNKIMGLKHVKGKNLNRFIKTASLLPGYKISSNIDKSDHSHALDLIFDGKFQRYEAAFRLSNSLNQKDKRKDETVFDRVLDSKISTSLSVNTAFVAGDKIGLDYTIDSDFENSRVLLSYGLPIFTNGLRLNFSFSRNVNESASRSISSVINNVDYAFTYVYIYKAEVDYPLIALTNRGLNLNLNYKYEAGDAEDDAKESFKNSFIYNQKKFETSLHFTNVNSYISFDHFITYEHGDAPRRYSVDTNSYSPKYNESYNKVKTDITLNLVKFNPKFLIVGSMSAQSPIHFDNHFNKSHLSKNEQFALSDGKYCKGYKVGLLTNDVGFAYDVSFVKPTKISIRNIFTIDSIRLFLDGGHVTSFGNFIEKGFKNSEYLVSTGLILNGSIFKHLTWDIVVGIPVSEEYIKIGSQSDSSSSAESDSLTEKDVAEAVKKIRLSASIGYSY